MLNLFQHLFYKKKILNYDALFEVSHNIKTFDLATS